ncbi:hypothetical protein MMC24_007249 [Lignoscripta atroalba]|nr:hypothetical protein [Lignoscripta atroalba]
MPSKDSFSDGDDKKGANLFKVRDDHRGLTTKPNSDDWTLIRDLDPMRAMSQPRGGRGQ